MNTNKTSLHPSHNVVIESMFHTQDFVVFNKGLDYDGGFGSSTYTPSSRKDGLLIQTRTTTLETTPYISTSKGLISNIF